MTDLVGLVGVYHAESGVRGELTYVLGRLLGTAHCALCAITHAGVRRKPTWDAMVARLGIPVELLHRNEVPPAVAAPVMTAGTPLVAARRRDGSVDLLLGPGDLELDGSISRVEQALIAALGGRDQT